MDREDTEGHFRVSDSYGGIDSSRGRHPAMSTFRNATSNASIAAAVDAGHDTPAFDAFGRQHTPSESPTVAPSTSAPVPGLTSVLVERRRPKAGILRLDINKPRRSSGGSVEFREQPQWLGENSNSANGVTSPHQLSVTWAETCDINESHWKFKPMQECTEDAELTPTSFQRANALEERQTYDLSSPVELGNCESPPQHYLTDEYNSSNIIINNNWNNNSTNNNNNNNNNSNQEQDNNNDGNNDNNDDDNDDNDDDEEDYSISVSAIMQRRASIRGYRNKRGSRCSRRASSPMDHVLDSMEARRRSSVYTSSSDEGTNQESTQEQIFENIRLHKEVIQSVKLQPWPIRKKLKLVRQAKTYVARHEGALQERFAMSRSTKDLFARFKILMAARWRHWKRETSSFLTVLIPWELRIKEIESHFGSGVASYFTFLRWLMWVNIMIAIPLVAFVIGPEYFATKHDETDPRKKMSDHEYKVAGNLFTIWEFEGYLKYSPMFYGYYSSFSGASSLGYKLPLAYFLTAVVVYIYSFVATLRKMAENSRNSKLSSKDDECTFSWKLFTGWDFMIGHAETAHNRIASVVVGFKEALLEEAEKKKDKRNWRIILQRILVNILVMGLLAASGYTVVLLVNKSEELARQDNWLSRNAVNVTMTLISFFLPMIFEALGLFENWHPRQQLRLQLARIMILNMLNLYSLMFSFIYKINSKEKPLQDLKTKNETATIEMTHLTTLIQALSTTLGYDTPGFGVTSTTPIAVTDDSGGMRISSTPTGSDENWMGRTTTDMFFTTTAATTSLLSATFNRLKCYNITVKCSKPNRITKMPTLATTFLFMNLTTTMWPLTTEPISSSQTNTPSDYLMATSGLSTVDTTTNIDELSTITRSAGTTMIGKFLTTLGANEYDKTSASTLDTTNTDDTFTTTTPSARTTPVGSNFFDFYDYFAGFPIELDKDISKEKGQTEGPIPTLSKTIKPTIKRPLKESTTRAQNAKQIKKRSATIETSGSPSSISFSTTIPHGENDSRNAGMRNRKSLSNLLAYTGTSSPIKAPTRASPLMRPTKDYFMDTTTPGDTTEVTGNSGIQSDVSTNRANIDSNLDNNTDGITTSQSELWVPNAELRELLAYFTNSSTLPTPRKTKISSTADTTTTTRITTTTSATTTEVATERTTESSTPYFIDDDDIEDIGEPSYYDMHELNDSHFEPCIRTICEEILPTELYTSRTTELDGTTDIAIIPARTPLERHQLRLMEVKALLSEVQKNLTNMCWETSLGQELSKVIVFDGLMGIVAPLCIDFLRALFVRYVNQNWCWDMEKTFPQYGDFKIAENILTLIYNQGQVWMGIFFSPGLVLINLVKLIIMMYFRSWIVLTCNVPHEVVFKASKSNNFYLTLLLTMLFLCVLPVGYAIVWLRPSWHCGPFSDYNRIAEFITNTTRNALPRELHEPLDYLTSASTVIPLLLLLVLIIYYLVSLTGALREANQDLRTQLQKEREEERRKMFKVPETKPTEPPAATLTSRWRKVLEASSPVTPTQPPDFETEEYKNQARKELISRIMKKALRKGSATSDEDSVVRHGRDDDDTDTEHHDSLPHDEEGKERTTGATKLQQIRRTRKPSLVDIVQIAKSERERERQASIKAAGIAGAPTTKEAHPRSRLKLERHERREKNDKAKNEEKTKELQQPSTPTPTATPIPSPTPTPTPIPTPTPSENDNDPEINSRIVNERRQSLLRRKREDERQLEKSTQEITSTDTPQTGMPTSTVESPCPAESDTQSQKEVVAPRRRDLRSSFRVINEKKSQQDTGNPSQKRLLPGEHSPSQEGGKFKFIRQRLKSPTKPSGEPEVFKFEQKSFKKRNQKLGKPVDIPSIPGSDTGQRADLSDAKLSGDETTPPQTPSVLKHTNSEKLASLSRQGKKKIGSFLQLMREAARKFEMEQLQEQQQQHQPHENESKAISEPTTPLPTGTLEPVPEQTSTVVLAPEALKSTTIMIPKDLEALDSTSPPIDLTGSNGSPETLTDDHSKPEKETPNHLQRADQVGPITFQQRSVSLQRLTSIERVIPMRQEPQSSNWSDNIPTITISTTGSDECVAVPESTTPPKTQQQSPPDNAATAPSSPAKPTLKPRDSNSNTNQNTSTSHGDCAGPSSSPGTATVIGNDTGPKVNIIKITIEDDK